MHRFRHCAAVFLSPYQQWREQGRQYMQLRLERWLGLEEGSGHLHEYLADALFFVACPD
jgi:hypothetical protein